MTNIDIAIALSQVRIQLENETTREGCRQQANRMVEARPDKIARREALEYLAHACQVLAQEEGERATRTA